VQQARALRPYRLTWLEEPVWPPEDYRALRMVRDEGGIPVAADENAATHPRLHLPRRPGALRLPAAQRDEGRWHHRVLFGGGASGAARAPLAPHSPYFGPGLLAALQMAALFPALRSVERLYAQL